MKMKNLLLALLCCFFSFNTLEAQDDLEGCNTPEPTQAQLDYHNLFEGLMFGFDLNAQPNTIYTIPITAHIVRLDNGTGGLTAQQLDDAIAIANSYYLNAKLQFAVCGINYMDDNNYYDYNIGDEYAMTTAHNVENTINIYFVNSIQGGLYCGYTRIPPSSDVMLMANNCTTSGNTLSHELGHYFSLYHTHGKTNFGKTDELVNGSNCETAGDEICDTPADPNLYGKVNGFCEYANSETDANGMLYTPYTNNIMSYAPKFCRNEFTQGQYERILFGYLNHRYYLTPDAGFVITTSNLNATFVNTSMGNGDLSYTWDFGDGNTSTMQDATHTYAAEGAYTVCLEVTDGCGIDVYCEDVSIFFACDVSANFETAISDLTVSFNNLSTGGMLPITYLWDFGDGNSSSFADPTHTYTTAGNYTVCLEVTDAEACVSTACMETLIVENICDVSANFETAISDLTVSFNNLSTGGMLPITYLWDFGDGNTSTFADPTHTYTTAGNYTVCLEVIDINDCSDIACTQVFIVENICDVSANFETAISDLTVSFNNLSTGGILPITYLWDFGDGNSSSFADPTHTYTTAGNYTVCLEVTDINDCSDIACIEITINNITNCLAADSLELVSFYNALGGDNWTNNDGWLTAPVSEWYGITLTDDGCGVKEISLNGTFVQSFGLVGSLVDWNFPSLTILNLYGNQLSGNIPNFINLPNLINLNLSYNQLNGNIPDFSNLSNLTWLQITNNQLNGNIPDFSNLSNLTFLNLSNNELSGNIPNFSNLSNISSLVLNRNQLSGIIPNFMDSPNLTAIYLVDNQLSGSIPDFSNFSDLVTLQVENNQFTFTGLENNVSNLNLSCVFEPCLRYSPQANIPIYQNGNTLYVSTGGTLSNNIYTWYKDGTEIATIAADSTFTATETGTYHCTVSNSIITNPDYSSQNLVLESDEIAITEITTTSVWPGDANNDGTVTVYDVLNIGLAYDATGIARPNATTNWQAEPCEDWNESFSDGLNYKYADCNGDAIINSDDIDVVDNNFGQTHNSGSPNLDANGIALNLSQDLFLAPTPENNQTFILDISANANLYGLAYTLDYTAACNFVDIDFGASCLGTEGIDFIKVVKNDVANHKLHIGISRINKTNANCGSVAKITMEILDLPADNNLFVSIENGIASSADETLSPITNNSINVLISAEPNCAAPSMLEEQNLTASGVTLAWNNTNAEAYQLAGRKVGGTPKVFDETTATFRTFNSGLEANTCYEWSVRAKCNGVWTDWHTPLAAFCTGTAKNGETYLEANDPFVSVENETFANLVLYPNPAKETAFLSVESSFETSVEILVFDILGKKVKTQTNELQIGSNELKLHIDALETGIYFVEISNGFEKRVQKLHIF